MLFTDYLVMGGVAVSERDWSTSQFGLANRDLPKVLDQAESEGTFLMRIGDGAHLELRYGLPIDVAMDKNLDLCTQPRCFTIGEPGAAPFYWSAVLPDVVAGAAKRDASRTAVIRAIVDASSRLGIPASSVTRARTCALLAGPGTRLVSTCTPVSADPARRIGADLAAAFAFSIFAEREASVAAE